MASSSKEFFLYQYLGVIGATFEAGKTFKLDIIGRSMSLALVEGDAVVLDKPVDIKRRDIILYKSGPNKFNLHRVVKLGDKYKVYGDNNIACEEVDPSIIIAKVVYIVKGKNGKIIKAGSFRFVFDYVLCAIRRFFRKVKRRLTR